MAAPMSNANMPDVHCIRKMVKDNLVSLMESMPGRKDLVLDPQLMRPLDRIAGATLLKEHGVDKIFKLEAASGSLQGCNQRLYLVRPRLEHMRIIADQINADKAANHKRQYKILFTPRKLHVCETILEQEGVYGDITMDEFHLDLIPLDTDILSLELPGFFKTFFLDSDQSWIHTVAKSLVNLQTIFGPIPNVYGLGRCAKMSYEMMESLFDYQGEPQSLNSEIGHMFLLDRDMDYVTALCSQVTYEGLLDDTFGIQSGLIEFGPEVTGTNKSMKLLLTSQDTVYEQIRNRHFSHVFGYLSSKAKELQAGYDKRHNLATVGDMKNFVANDLRDLKAQHKALTMHIGASEVILKKKSKGDFEEQLHTEHALVEGIEKAENISYIEECINRQYNANQTLRLMCLLSQTRDGLSQRDYHYLKTQFLQSHGFEFMLTFFNLKKLGLLTEREVPQSTGKPLGKAVAAMAALPKKSQFQALSKKLGLIPKSAEDIDLQNPTDMAYVFSGAYTPMSCKLIEQVLNKDGFSGMDDILKLFDGPHFSRQKAKSAKGRSSQTSSPGSRVVLVYFLGGCTFTEIAALRFLGKLKGYTFIVATTSIITGASMIEQLYEKP